MLTFSVAGKKPVSCCTEFETFANMIAAPARLRALVNRLRLSYDSLPFSVTVCVAALCSHGASTLPSAARGHAIEHELALGDTRKAFTLAEADYAARPHGQTAIMLATAQLANGQAAKARDLLRRTERSGWVSARAAALLAQAEALLGNGKASDAAREKALAIDPRIFDPAQSYIWFGHG